MSVDLSQYRTYVIDDFSGGLNESASSYQLKNNELQSCQNISLRDKGAIKSRLGERKYQDQTTGSDKIVLPVKGMHRYTRSDGINKVIIHSGKQSGSVQTTGIIFADDDAGDFDADNPIAEIVTGNDGRTRFAQFNDTVYMSNERAGVGYYNPDDENPVGSAGGSMSGICSVASDIFDVGTLSDSGGSIQGGGFYTYRFTADIYRGNDFVCETSFLSSIIREDNNNIGRKYVQLNVSLVGVTVNSNKIPIRRDARDEYTAPWPIGAKYINIYRYGPYTSTYMLSSTNYETNFYKVGVISTDDFDNASYLEDVWVDTGAAALDVRVRLGGMPVCPLARFICVHKERLWFAYTNYYAYSDRSWPGELTLDNSRVYVSELNEPEFVRASSWIRIDPSDGEGITGMISYRDEFLVVFKSNSIWAITGDNPRPPGEGGNIAVRNISQDIGCIAPESIAVVDGAVFFLSNRGIYAMTGTGIRSVDNDRVRTTLLGIPESSRKEACSAYHVREGEYWLSFNEAEETKGYNTSQLRYGLKNNSWSKDIRTFGISSFLVKKSPDERTVLLGGVGDAPASVSTESAVLELDIGNTDSIVVAGTPDDIDWNFKTKFFDCGAPYMEKNFIAVLIQLKAPADTSLDVFCDERYDTEKSGDTFTVSRSAKSTDLIWDDGIGTPPAANVWNNAADDYNTYWAAYQEFATLQMLNDKCWGKRIAFKFSGSNHSFPVEIQSITIYYEPREGDVA